MRGPAKTDPLLTEAAQLQAVLACVEDAVCVYDQTARLVTCNPATVAFHRDLSGSDGHKTLADLADLLEMRQPDGTPVGLAKWPALRALRGETGVDVVYRIRRTDTGETWMACYRFAPIADTDGCIRGSVVTARDITRQRRVQDDHRTAQATLQRLVAVLQDAQEDERKRVARELHDDLQQSLASIRMDASAASERLDADASRVRPLLARMDRTAAAALESTRRIVKDLRPGMLEEMGLIAALEGLCAEHAQRSLAAYAFRTRGSHLAPLLSDRVLSLSLYRIAQEALNNVAKHAMASQVQVQLEGEPGGQIVLCIADNGIGMAPGSRSKPGSCGLLGMAERARAMGAQLRIDEPRGEGTRIEVVVPGHLRHDDSAQPGGFARLDAATLQRGAPPASVPDLWGRPLQAVIDAMDGQIAVLDATGVVQMVNRGWREFAALAGGAAAQEGCGPGVSYLAVCRRSAPHEPMARTVLAGLGAVIAGRDEAFLMEYPCVAPDACRWFRLHAASITGGWTMVSHVEINAPGCPA
jgi:signal transduction histidine kinase